MKKLLLLSIIILAGCSDSHSHNPDHEHDGYGETEEARERKDLIAKYASQNFIFGGHKWGSKIRVQDHYYSDEGKDPEHREYPVEYIWYETGARVYFHYDNVGKTPIHAIYEWPSPEANS